MGKAKRAIDVKQAAFASAMRPCNERWHEDAPVYSDAFIEVRDYV